MPLDVKACGPTDGGSMAATVLEDYSPLWRLCLAKSMNKGVRASRSGGSLAVDVADLLRFISWILALANVRTGAHVE
jgi:hypothetical protein